MNENRLISIVALVLLTNTRNCLFCRRSGNDLDVSSVCCSLFANTESKCPAEMKSNPAFRVRINVNNRISKEFRNRTRTTPTDENFRLHTDCGHVVRSVPVQPPVTSETNEDRCGGRLDRVFATRSNAYDYSRSLIIYRKVSIMTVIPGINRKSFPKHHNGLSNYLLQII